MGSRKGSGSVLCYAELEDFATQPIPPERCWFETKCANWKRKSKEQLIRQIETSSASARLSPNLGSGDSGTTLKLIQAQQDQVLSQLKSQPASGRQVVNITADIDSWANTPADIELRRGDVLTIPSDPASFS
jgi:hypothetical protein